MRIVVAGAGSVGTYLIERLLTESHDLIVIDTSEKILEEIASDYDVQTIVGSASSLPVLLNAGVDSADMFIAVTDSDETNLLCCLLADGLNAEQKKIARVRELLPLDLRISPRLSEAFDHLSNPDSEAVAAISRLVEIPGAVEVMEFGDGKVLVIGVMLDESAPLNGCRLRELPERVDASDLLVVAINREGTLIVPRGEDRLAEGDEIYVAVRADRVDAVYRLLGEVPREIKNVMMYGCTQLSLRLAHMLAERDVRTKLIEQDERLCQRAADSLSNTLVLRGDGTDQELLLHEGVRDCDLFIGASADEEENILSALLAKRMGARRVAVITTKSSYLNLVPELGIDIVVNPHIAAASSILRFVRASSISSTVSTRDDRAEVLEIVVEQGAAIANKPLREITLPVGAIVVARINGGDVEIPKGETVLVEGDRVIFFCSRAALPKLQKFLR